MDLTVWRTFVTVYRLGSLSAAADELGYTQSAVSRQIAGLERRLGTELIRRQVRGVRPTPAGEVFHHHALIALDEADRAVRAVRDLRDGAFVRPLTVGATPSLAAGIVPTAVRRLLDDGLPNHDLPDYGLPNHDLPGHDLPDHGLPDHGLPGNGHPGTGRPGKGHPGTGRPGNGDSSGGVGPLPWTLTSGLSGDLHERVSTGRLDVAVVTDAPPGLPHDPRVGQRFLGTDEMVVVLPVGHPLAGSGPLPVARLADESWVEDNDGSAALLRRHAARAGVTARIDLVAADLPGKTALVATGHAIALIPGSLTPALRTDVTTVRLVDPPTRGIYAITPHRSPHPATASLLAHLATAFSSARSPEAREAVPDGTP
ncbi:LysR family transcriptional regulator [Streptomyces sp. NPDC088789]|uniref:LysR family transcriptional regulator n=1 Tax=Streptomyces sp. NPDC088789 TaxID=3365899 RepID=UPI0037F8A398